MIGPPCLSAEGNVGFQSFRTSKSISCFYGDALYRFSNELHVYGARLTAFPSPFPISVAVFMK